MVYTPLFSNEAMGANSVGGATHMDTVTVPNPSPPTNITSAGVTPPANDSVVAGTPANPFVFAANSGGVAHEGAANDSLFTIGSSTMVYCGEPWSFTPNRNHPSSDDYTGATTVGAGSRDAVGRGEDVMYADEDFEDEEEDAAEAAAREKRGEPRRKKGRK